MVGAQFLCEGKGWQEAGDTSGLIPPPREVQMVLFQAAWLPAGAGGG